MVLYCSFQPFLSRFGYGLGLATLLMAWLVSSSAAHAGELADRIAQFPHWDGQPIRQVARGDLVYPDWFQGTWNVTTTLVDLAAPLAPELTTPGFDSNRPFLNQPISFQARFKVESPRRRGVTGPFPLPPQELIVADRAFNSFNLAKAYFGDPSDAQKNPVLAVKVDPTNPNRQVMLLRHNRQLVSTITHRAMETPDPAHFITTEVFQQEFLGTSQPYFNRVETTTAYERADMEPTAIRADQITAIYLSPQDPDYFKASDRPVALYRYHLEFSQAQIPPVETTPHAQNLRVNREAP